MANAVEALKDVTRRTQEQMAQLKSLADRIIARQKSLEGNSERSAFNSRNQEIIRYIRPDLSPDLGSNTSKGHTRGHNMFTDKPYTALTHAADAFIGNVLVPHGWFGYEMRVEPVLARRYEEFADLNDEDEVQEWLQDCELYMAGVYATSNFYAVMPPVAMDALSLGDGIAYVNVDEDNSPYVDYCEFMNTWIVRDHFMRIIVAHRRVEYTALEAYERWGMACSSAVIADATGGDPANPYKFLHVVYRRTDNILKGIPLGAQREFYDFWIQEENESNPLASSTGGKDFKTGILAEEYHSTMPYVDWPYMLKSSETYGRGAMGLVSIKRLHAFWKAYMLHAQRGAAPPLIGDSALKEQLDLSPDGVTWTQNPEAVLREVYNRGVRPDVATDFIERQEKEIDDMLHLNLFLAMTLTQKDMRVDEVHQRIGEQAAALQPRLGLLNSLTLSQIHERFWSIEEKAGRLPKPPPVILAYADALHQLRPPKNKDLADVNVHVVKVRYKGPLAQAQESLFMQRRLGGGVTAMQIFGNIDPEAVADKVDVANGIEEIFDRTDFPQKAIRKDDEFQQRQLFRQQLAMAQIEAQTGREEAEGQSKLAKAEETYSKLENQ